jgi:hypothetical protein
LSTRSFRLVKRISADICVIEFYSRREPGKSLWTLRKLRRDTVCAETGVALKKGEEHFGPIGNQMFRAKRLSRAAVAAAAEVPYTD